MEKANSANKEKFRARRVETEHELALARQEARKAFWKSEEGRAARSDINRDFYANDPEFRAQTDARNRKYAKEHPEKMAQYQHERYMNDPEFRAYVAKKSREFMKTPAGKVCQARITHRRRAREDAVKADLTLGQLKVILDRQGNRCKHCGREFTKDLPYTIDHIIPVSRGGPLTFENAQCLCSSCNSRKRDHLECELPYLKKTETVTTTVVTTVTTLTEWNVV